MSKQCNTPAILPFSMPYGESADDPLTPNVLSSSADINENTVDASVEQIAALQRDLRKAFRRNGFHLMAMRVNNVPQSDDVFILELGGDEDTSENGSSSVERTGESRPAVKADFNAALDPDEGEEPLH